MVGAPLARVTQTFGLIAPDSKSSLYHAGPSAGRSQAAGGPAGAGVAVAAGAVAVPRPRRPEALAAAGAAGAVAAGALASAPAAGAAAEAEAAEEAGAAVWALLILATTKQRERLRGKRYLGVFTNAKNSPSPPGSKSETAGVNAGPSKVRTPPFALPLRLLPNPIPWRATHFVEFEFPDLAGGRAALAITIASSASDARMNPPFRSRLVAAAVAPAGTGKGQALLPLPET